MERRPHRSAADRHRKHSTSWRTPREYHIPLFEDSERRHLVLDRSGVWILKIVDLCQCARFTADESRRWPKLPRDTYGWRNRTTASFIYFRAASGEKFAGQHWDINDHAPCCPRRPFWERSMAGIQRWRYLLLRRRSDSEVVLCRPWAWGGQVNSLRFGPRGALWVATENGLSRIKRRPRYDTHEQEWHAL